ncbi:MAG TPA: sugar transferase [Candidatus Cybelea sp.]|nr:sugar transferase [Candidatus Cybelea sp.]
MSRQLEFVLKRLFDAVVAGVSLVICIPLFAVIAAAICIDSPGKPIFVQDRVGRNGNRFRMLKFRTMIRNAERVGSGFYVSRSDPRITRVGRFLRRLSLDEMPQLWNVLVGEMSLVGPRPALGYHVEHYTPRQAARLSVRPGLTGWSQVNGRNQLKWPERLELDVWYANHFSLWLDARILLRTLAVWVSGHGLYAERDRFFFSGRDDIPAPSRRNL